MHPIRCAAITWQAQYVAELLKHFVAPEVVGHANNKKHEVHKKKYTIAQENDNLRQDIKRACAYEQHPYDS